MNENEQNDEEEKIRGWVNEEVTTFSDTEEFIDFAFKNEQQKKMLIKEIKDIIHCMKEILFTPPYDIILGQLHIR